MTARSSSARSARPPRSSLLTGLCRHIVRKTKGGDTVEFERLDEIPSKNPHLLVKVVEAGNVVEVQYMSHRNNKQTVQMLPGGEQILVCSTGEVKDI